MDYVYVTKENIEQEHICCAISSNSDVQVRSKKDWLGDRFEGGLVFLKSSVRGKCFIEYIPAKNAWIPIDAGNYMYIDCLWVAGSLKGHGYSSELLNLCIEDSKKKGMDGICILSSKKKMPYLADPKFLAYKGFRVCDEASNGIQLWYLAFNDSNLPKFKSCAKNCHISESGFVLYYTSQCPFNAKYVPIIENLSKEMNIEFKAIHLDTKEKAQNAPTPITTYALFYNGDYVTNDVMNEKKFLKVVEKLK